ncbi:MAG: alpha/beta fold hydrolase [Mesorhizobium sp.]|uniref:alpha/beta fold hydrolase n=1 Tax=Mesorhizobium sp. TaxID=1871066 RepID=UPI000FE9CC76|nr:alpha/beta fold hydrolase [Mesorhizobium sp.]RWM81225.1 MAG: alpha/beta fold hydrolase [Mesorhizobium sp.]
MDIADWLQALGMQHYKGAFTANDVDLELLPKLTAADLEAIGISSVGHRRRLLDAISQLVAETEPSAQGSEIVRLAGAFQSQDLAERRHLTVMFVDLVGSTELAERLDPEDLRTTIRLYQDACSALIVTFGGFVAKYLGDGILAYFGWPRAHEEEADRSVRAGLAIAEATTRLIVPGGPLSVRVGIATGLVVVGDLIGEGAAREEAVVGETPNLAARLQQTAEPGTIVVADATRRLLGASFEMEELPAARLRGFAEPTRVWKVINERPIAERFERRRALGLTKLVGRRRETAVLLDRWELAKGGKGQVVLLSGEPGIGKSRITDELRQRLSDHAFTSLRFQCSAENIGSALHPIISRIESACGINRNDTPTAKLAKLEMLLEEEFGDATSVTPLVAALLGIPFNENYPPLGLTPRQQKAKTLETLATEIQCLAARQPVLFSFEDIHWADPTSLEFLDIVVNRIERLPVMAILTFRPEFEPVWPSVAHVTQLSLSRLGRRYATALAKHVAAGAELPARALERILARTDGIPLFVEELTKAEIEASSATPRQKPYLDRATSRDDAIPSILHDFLMARLDRLGGAKDVAQLASCLGREFSHEMLAAVSRLHEGELEAAINRLVASELIERAGSPSTQTYMFRHALIQETAYTSLLKSRRQRLHAHIAETVEAQFPEITSQRPEWLAYHFAEGSIAMRAATYWLRASQLAKDAYALREAAAHLQKCLDQIAKLRSIAPTAHFSEARAQECEALVLLGDVKSLMGQLEPANRYYQRAMDLVDDDGDSSPISRKQHLQRVAVRGGTNIAYYEHGVGSDTLVIVSPLAYGLATIQPVLERLCQDFRIVTIDARGSGASDLLTRPYPIDEHVKDLRAVLGALGDKPVVGVGISAGGNTLFKLAYQEPQLFTKLVTLGTPPKNEAFSAAYLRIREEDLRREDLEGLLRSHTDLIYHEPEMLELKEQIIRDRMLLPKETILSFFEFDPTKDVTGLLKWIRLPTLVMHGRDDHLIPFSAAEQIATVLPNAQLYAFEGKGHLPIFTATDEFCRVLQTFAHT